MNSLFASVLAPSTPLTHHILFLDSIPFLHARQAANMAPSLARIHHQAIHSSNGLELGFVLFDEKTCAVSGWPLFDFSDAMLKDDIAPLSCPKLKLRGFWQVLATKSEKCACVPFFELECNEPRRYCSQECFKVLRVSSCQFRKARRRLVKP